MNNDKIVHGAEKEKEKRRRRSLVSFSLSLRQCRLKMCASSLAPCAVGLLEFFNVPLCGYFEVWRNWISFGRRLQNARLSLACKCTCYLTGCVKIRSFCEYKSGFVEAIRITNGSNFCVYVCAIAHQLKLRRAQPQRETMEGIRLPWNLSKGNPTTAKTQKEGTSSYSVHKYMSQWLLVKHSYKNWTFTSMRYEKPVKSKISNFLHSTYTSISDSEPHLSSIKKK